MAMTEEEKKERKKKYDAEWYHLVREKKCESASRWRKENPERAKRKSRDWKLQKDYGITVEQYEEMARAQDGRCAICRGEPNGKGGLHVDHCHKTGKVRGLLCYTCNAGIGFLKDDTQVIQRVLEYLHASSAS